MKVLKIGFSIILLLIIVMAFAISALIYFVDPNQLKPVIIEEVKKESGYQLMIEGDVSWAFYPRIAFKINRLTLTAPNEALPMIEATDIRVAADLTSLMHAKEKWDGDITMATMTLHHIHANQVSASLSWKNNVLTMMPVAATMYEGKIEGWVEGKNLTATREWKWDLQGDGINIQSLLQDVNGKTSRLNVSGKGQLKIQAETKGNTKEEIQRNITGLMTFGVQQGIVEGIDLNYWLKSAEAILNKEKANPPENTNQTAFDHMTGSVTLKHGVAETNDLLLTSSAFTATAKGTLELNSRMLDMKLQIKPQENAPIRWKIPVLVSGDTERPEVRLDTMAIQGFLTAQEIDKFKEKARDQIKKHISGKTGELLQELFR